jgi:F420-non-reducing hydrogenase large subunit
MTRISIDPVTRLEGHGRIEILLDEHGEAQNAYFQVPELRGFERFCVGRPAEDMPNLTDRICGVCPEAHHMAATKALDALFHVEPPPAARKLRELFYSIFFATDHTTHFYALGGPDFIVGPDAPKAERNILGVIKKVGKDAAARVLKMRHDGHALIAMIGGRRVHPNWGLPGGVSRGITDDQRQEILARGREAVEFARFSLQAFDEIVLGNPGYVEMIRSDAFTHRTYDMGMVDAKNRVNFYDGEIRVTDPDGREAFRYAPRDYLSYVAERVEPWTYLKFPYLKKVGWKGLVDGKDSGVYKATPLSRLNASAGMATPLAQEEYERMYATLGGKPVHHTLATHWARLIELLYAAERWVELAGDPEVADPNVRALPKAKPDEGVGCVEAPRGTLTHHYWTDERGLLTRVNLVVGTTNNYAPIALSVKKAAMALIRRGTVVTDGLLDRVEMAFRAYDPCFGCATHALPGQMPLEVAVRAADGSLVAELRR